MNVRRRGLVAITLLVLASAAYADGVSWVPGSTSPTQWSISPAKPTPADIITFSGPTSVYSNSCLGQRSLGGIPELVVDTKTKTITLWFQGPVPQVCTMIYSPVAGLEGSFGPLPAGDWTFTCLSRELSFEVQFTVAEKYAYHVDADAPGPIHDGRSWSTAMLTLQEALAAAGSGDQILLAAGTYRPDQGPTPVAGSRQASFVLKEGVTIRGGYAGYGEPDPDERDLAQHATILSGDLNSNDQGGLNRSDNSLHVVTGPADGLAATLDGLVIAGGNADGAFPHHYGGGLYNVSGKVQAVNCTFRNNTAIWGGAVTNFGPALTLVNCQLVGNRALMLGGGLYNYEGAVTLVNARIVGNTAAYADIAGGAAIYNLDGTVTVLDSTIADNLSPIGRAIAGFTWATDSAVKVKVVNSILFNGGDEVWSNDRTQVDVTYSDVQGGWSGTGNIDTDPQFVQPGTWGLDGTWVDGDYRLKAASAAIDAGSNAALAADSLDLDADADMAEPLPFDLDNEARIEGTLVDMGAYEQLAKKPTPTPSVDLIVAVGDGYLTLAPDPQAPSSSNTFLGSTEVNIAGMNFRGRLSVEVASASAAGGTWTGWVDPEIVGPGPAVVTLWVRGENLDLAALPADARTVEVAEVTVYITPVE